MLTYRDFSNREHSIDPSEIIGFEEEPMGSCYMLTRGGLRLDNMSSSANVRREIERMRANKLEQELTSLREEGMKDRYALRRAVEMLEAEQNIAKELRQAVVDFSFAREQKSAEEVMAHLNDACDEHSALIDRARKAVK